MRVFGANITSGVIDFFEKRDKRLSLDLINSELEKICGIKYFFSSQTEISDFFQAILTLNVKVSESDRAEYGDFQTNIELSNAVCKLLEEEAVSPDVVIEPTCGKGSFILSVLKTFKNIKSIYGIEIYKPYVWETKFAILDFFLKHPEHSVPAIEIIHQSIFNFDFNTISSRHQNQKLLVIGNPPWVTNSKLSALGSQNLPSKSNFKKHTGIEAITGKGNFDIGESVSLKLVQVFSHFKGNFAFLIKNSVVK